MVTGLIVIRAQNAGHKKIFTLNGMLVIRAKVKDIAYAKIHFLKVLIVEKQT